MNRQKLKEFVKRFRAALMPDVVSTTPMILLEFKSEESIGFQSRIEIYEMPRDDLVRYRHIDRGSQSIREWPLRQAEYEVLRIIPPTRSLVPARNRSLGLIQVRKYHD